MVQILMKSATELSKLSCFANLVITTYKLPVQYLTVTKLNTKAIVVNRHFNNECRKGNGSIYFISNSNINSKHDCNSKRLYSKSFICLEQV